MFVDGSNLYNSQYELFGPDKFLDFSLLVKGIETHLKVLFSEVYFYASYSPKSKHPTLKEKRYLKNEAIFYKSVKRAKNISFFKGYRSKTSGKEKEVDVKLAVDLVDYAHRKAFSKAFLLSGDADFMQALHTIRNLRITTVVLSMQNKVMFKAILFYKTYIIRFDNNNLRFRKIKKLPQYISLDRNDVVKKI